MGTCDTRGHGPPAQWLSLPFYTPEGALSANPLGFRGGGGTIVSVRKGGFLTPPRFPRGEIVSVVTSPTILRA